MSKRQPAFRLLPRLMCSLMTVAAAACPPSRYPFLHAQTPAREPAVVELPNSARASALGLAYQLGVADADGLFYNPALVTNARGIMMGVQRFGKEGLATSLAGSVAWWGGGVGLGLATLAYGGQPSLLGMRDGGPRPFYDVGAISVSEMVVTAAYGREVGDFRVGLATKLVDQRRDMSRGGTYAVDLGSTYAIRRVTLGLALQDLGPQLDLGPAGSAGLPTRVTLGAGSYGQTLGAFDVGAAAAVTVRRNKEIVVGGGVEVGYWPIAGRTFVGRLGVFRDEWRDGAALSVGASYWGDNLVVDYALEPLEGEVVLHRLTVGWRSSP